MAPASRSRAGALRAPREVREPCSACRWFVGGARTDHEDRAGAEAFRRGAVAEDELADGAAPARVAIVEILGDACECPAADGDLHLRVGEQVEGPGAPGRPGRDEDRAVRLLDETHGDRARRAAPPAADDEAGEAVVGGEVGVEGGIAPGRAGGNGVGGTGVGARRGSPRGAAVSSRIVRAGRQRLRCQDLPSVATDGA